MSGIHERGVSRGQSELWMREGDVLFVWGQDGVNKGAH